MFDFHILHIMCCVLCVMCYVLPYDVPILPIVP